MKGRLRLMFVVACLLWVPGSARALAAPTVSLSPTPLTVPVSQTATVNLTGAGFTQTTEGGGVSLHFNPARIQVLSVTVDATVWDFFTSVGAIDNVNGVVNDIVFASFSGRSGNPSIAVISFRVISAGTSALTLTESTLNPFASGGQHLVVTLGQATVNPPGAPIADTAMACLAIVLFVAGALRIKRLGAAREPLPFASMRGGLS